MFPRDAARVRAERRQSDVREPALISDAVTLSRRRDKILLAIAYSWYNPAMARHALQTAFFAQMADAQGFLGMFEHLPGVFFVVKDRQGRFVAANSATCSRLGVAKPEDLIGKTDSDFLPAELVRDYRNDDLRVIRTGKPLLDRLEAWVDEQRQLKWFITTKLPVRGRTGRSIGVMIAIRRYDERRSLYSVNEAADVVRYLRTNRNPKLSNAELAAAVGISERSLHRKIRQAMGLTPHEFMLRMRIEAAAELLATTDQPISQIAIQYGFCDQSAFTKQFSRRIGMTPKQFRRQQQG
jgi:PAS domain S-box-containing protein